MKILYYYILDNHYARQGGPLLLKWDDEFKFDNIKV
jgi:hypothetical protein